MPWWECHLNWNRVRSGVYTEIPPRTRFAEHQTRRVMSKRPSTCFGKGQGRSFQVNAPNPAIIKQTGIADFKVLRPCMCHSSEQKIWMVWLHKSLENRKLCTWNFLKFFLGGGGHWSLTGKKNFQPKEKTQRQKKNLLAALPQVQITCNKANLCSGSCCYYEHQTQWTIAMKWGATTCAIVSELLSCQKSEGDVPSQCEIKTVKFFIFVSRTFLISAAVFSFFSSLLLWWFSSLLFLSPMFSSRSVFVPCGSILAPFMLPHHRAQWPSAGASLLNDITTRKVPALPNLSDLKSLRMYQPTVWWCLLSLPRLESVGKTCSSTVDHGAFSRNKTLVPGVCPYFDIHWQTAMCAFKKSLYVQCKFNVWTS